MNNLNISENIKSKLKNYYHQDLIDKLRNNVKFKLNNKINYYGQTENYSENIQNFENLLKSINSIDDFIFNILSIETFICDFPDFNSLL